jgi:hypothetical protein
MTHIHIITKSFADLLLSDPNIGRNATDLLVNRKLSFKLTFQDISEQDFLKGVRNSSLVVSVTEPNNSDTIFENVFVHHGTAPSTAHHLRNDRYISAFCKDIHFITVWSNRLNNYCEFILYDYAKGTCQRFIP